MRTLGFRIWRLLNTVVLFGAFFAPWLGSNDAPIRGIDLTIQGIFSIPFIIALLFDGVGGVGDFAGLMWLSIVFLSFVGSAILMYAFANIWATVRPQTPKGKRWRLFPLVFALLNALGCGVLLLLLNGNWQLGYWLINAGLSSSPAAEFTERAALRHYADRD